MKNFLENQVQGLYICLDHNIKATKVELFGTDDTFEHKSNNIYLNNVMSWNILFQKGEANTTI